jgi:hypothetical protein
LIILQQLLPNLQKKVAAAYADGTSVAVVRLRLMIMKKIITNKNQPEILQFFAFLAQINRGFEGIQSLYNNRLEKKIHEKR